MRALLAVLAVLAMAIVAAPSLAQQPMMMVVEGDDNGSAFWFNLEGETERNPRLHFDPGANVSITFKNVGQSIHNLQFGAPINNKTELIGPGAVRVLNFTVPDVAYATGEYWCEPHRLQGMAGEMVIGEEPAAPPASRVPGFALVAGLVAAAAAAIALRPRP